MKLTHSEKVFLIEAVEDYPTHNSIGKRIDKRNLIKELREVTSVPSKESMSKPEKIETCTIQTIRSDYEKYGYLEDYQVEFLIGLVSKLKK